MTRPEQPKRHTTEKFGKHSGIGHPPPFAMHGSPRSLPSARMPEMPEMPQQHSRLNFRHFRHFRQPV